MCITSLEFFHALIKSRPSKFNLCVNFVVKETNTSNYKFFQSSSNLLLTSLENDKRVQNTLSLIILIKMLLIHFHHLL